jgi:hypothetical protein
MGFSLFSSGKSHQINFFFPQLGEIGRLGITKL